MKLNWKSTEDIGIALYDKMPDTDPLTVRFTDLRDHVKALEDFEDERPPNEAILEAIQMAWLEEYKENQEA